jgi:hypothetical protein
LRLRLRQRLQRLQLRQLLLCLELLQLIQPPLQLVRAHLLRRLFLLLLRRRR